MIANFFILFCPGILVFLCVILDCEISEYMYSKKIVICFNEKLYRIYTLTYIIIGYTNSNNKYIYIDPQAIIQL